MSSILPLTVLVPALAHAWSSLGSQTTALVAQNFLTANATHQCQGLLNDTSSTWLANVATWAATLAGTGDGAFTKPYHSLPALDVAPHACNVLYARDCPAEGCLASAVSNYTGILAGLENKNVERANAIKMLVALVGENAQPLHNGKENGTDIPVLWQGTASTLFDVWEHDMPVAIAGGDDFPAAQRWAGQIVQDMKLGNFSTAREGWLKDLSMCWTTYSSIVWSTEANAEICTKVMPHGPQAVRNTELGGKYFDGTRGYIDEQIARGGYRLAAWLNFIFTGDPQLPMPVDANVPACIAVTPVE